MLDRKNSISDKISERIKMFSGIYTETKEQKNEIIPVSSRENFESTLKFYSDAAQNSFNSNPQTFRSSHNYNEMIENKIFESQINGENIHDENKSKVKEIINNYNDIIKEKNEKRLKNRLFNKEIINENDSEDIEEKDLNVVNNNGTDNKFKEMNNNIFEEKNMGNIFENNEKNSKNKINENYKNKIKNENIRYDDQEMIMENKLDINNTNSIENNKRNTFDDDCKKYDDINGKNIENIDENNIEKKKENNIEGKNEIITENNKNNEENIIGKSNDEYNNKNIPINKIENIKEKINEIKNENEIDNVNIYENNNEIHGNNNINENNVENKNQENNVENKNTEINDNINELNKENKNTEINDNINELNKENKNPENNDNINELNKENKNPENNDNINELNEENKNNSQELNKDINTETNDNEKKDELNKENPNQNKSSEITKEMIEEWKKILCENIEKLESLDEELISKEKEKEKNDLVVEDIKNTRVKELSEYPSFHEDLELMINYFCDYNKIKYKKGLNDIIASFTLLKYKLDLSLPEILNLTQGLIIKYLTNYYYEETIFSLKSSFSLLVILLRYHSPRINNIFEKENIIPEMYAKNWFLTLFSHNLDLKILYYFWNKLIILDDELFFYFFLIALLIVNSGSILSSKPKNILKVLSKFTMTTFEEVDFIFQIAFDLRKETPYSFRLLANKLEIFNYKSNNLENLYEQYKPNSFLAMPIFPSEIFYICYNNIVKCPDEFCKNCIGITNTNNNNSNSESKENDLIQSMIFSKKENDIENDRKDYICPHCTKKIDNKMKYILLDLRILECDIFNSEEIKTPFLPKMIFVEQEELKSIDFAEKITKRFLKDKGTYHFIFMTSETNYFENLEESLYLVTQSSSKIETPRENLKKMNLKEQNNNQEFDNLKKLLISLLNAHYPYISFCYGGFLSIHDLSSKYNINLLNHDSNCTICNKNKTRKKRSNTLFKSFNAFKFWKKSHKNNDSEISSNIIEVIDKISLNDMTEEIKEKQFNEFHGILIEFKGDKIKNNKEIIIIIKYNELEILRYTKTSFDLEIIQKIQLLDINSLERYDHRKIKIKIMNKETKKVDFTIKVDLKNEEEAKKLFASFTDRKNNLIKKQTDK